MLYTILFLLFVLPYQGEGRLQTAQAIQHVAQENELNSDLTMAWIFLLAQESRFNPKIINKSSGALGIAQVMPKYVNYFREKIKDKSADPLSLYGGLRMSAWVFKDCYNKYPTKLATWACYYSGPSHACTKAVYRLDFTKKCPRTYKHVRAIAKRYNKWMKVVR